MRRVAGPMATSATSLYRELWGKDLDTIIEVKADPPLKFVSVDWVKKLHLQELNFNEKALLVRAEFISAIPMLDEICKTKKGVVVTGQPGIGKWFSPMFAFLTQASNRNYWSRKILLLVLPSSIPVKQENAYGTPNAHF